MVDRPTPARIFSQLGNYQSQLRALELASASLAGELAGWHRLRALSPVGPEHPLGDRVLMDRLQGELKFIEASLQAAQQDLKMHLALHRRRAGSAQLSLLPGGPDA